MKNKEPIILALYFTVRRMIHTNVIVSHEVVQYPTRGGYNFG